MICGSCGLENDEGAKFCGSCGEALPGNGVRSAAGAPCGACGAENEPGAKFCGSCGEPLPDEAGNLGPYELRGELGRGAMARVWRAWDPNLEREVALKEPLFDARLGADMLGEMGRRFVKEGKTAARLQHPGIVAIYAADVYDDRPAIVMELVEGSTLGDILEHGPLAPEAALDALDQLLDAVGYAHERGVVHRDIKPDNVFVSNDGRVKLADFGIARVEDSGATKATLVGTVLGTPGYMSPEQATGGAVDARSDLFSIGAVGYEMLSGRNPFGAGDGSDATTLLYRIVHEPAPELPAGAAAGLPADLRPAIMAALSKDPADRPQSAAEFKAMLHGGMEVPTANAARSSGFTSLSEAAQGQGGSLPKWLPYAAVAVACALVLFFVFGGALSGGGSGAGGAASGGAASAGASASATASSSPVYLAVKDDKVAIFTNSSAEPYEVTDIDSSVLGDEITAALTAHWGFPSVEEAQEKVKELQVIAQAAQEAAEEAAEEAAKKAEEKSKKAAADSSVVPVSIVGADGSTRTADIRRQGKSERVIPDSNTRRLTEGDISGLSDAERCIAWNEIIASSNGYAFKNSGLANYFAGCSWYHRDTGASGNGNLSADAAANVELLKAKTDSWWLHLATN